MTPIQVSYRKEQLHFKQPAGTSRGVYTTRDVWYVEVRGEDARRPIIGVGECAPLPQLSCDDVPHYETLLREACQRWQTSGKMPAAFLREYPSLLMGFETAERSYAACLQSGRPFLLYDTPFSRGERGIHINGLVWMGDIATMRQRVQEKIDAGFDCIKLKVGALDFEQEFDLIKEVRANFPSDRIRIRLDANGGFPLDKATEYLQRLAAYNIESIEQPVAQGNWEALARLVDLGVMRIALDEELIGIHSTEEKIRLLDTVNPDCIVLKPSLHGGFSGAEEWIKLARERGIGYWVTSALESNVGLNAIAQWCSQLEGHDATPQGLGTGQLFTDNYRHLHLSIEGQELWCTTAAERNFHRDVEEFKQEWCSSSSALMLHTSGSTGQPKPMMAQKKHMHNSAKATLDFFQLKAGDTALLCLPLQYVAGKMMMVRALTGGLRLHTTPPSSHPFADLLIPPTFVALTPMQALTTLRTPRERELLIATPKVLLGGGAISDELHEAVQACEGEVWSSYGMTETLSHIALRRLNGAAAEAAYRPLAGVELTQDEAGCLVIHAPAVGAERLVTNDIVRLLPDGRFTVRGRRDNVVCSGGIKLQIEELEQRLGKLPCDFLLTYIADAMLGQALTMLHLPTTAPLSKLCAAQLSPYECPKHFIEVQELPRTTSGKIARAAAHELAEQRFTHKP